MKKIVLVLMLLTGTLTYAQRFNLGIKAGVNFATLTGDSDIDLENKTGYHIGAIAEVGLNDQFSVQPEIIYSTQGAKLESEDFDINYLNVPVLAKVYVIKTFSLMVGPQFGYVIDNNGNGLDYKDFDLSGSAGAEIKVLSFFAQARYNFGLSEVSDGGAKNAVFQLSVGFNFL